MFSSSSDISRSLITNPRKQSSIFNVLLANARSLLPKIDSLVDSFRNLDLNCAIITESWLRPGLDLEREIEEFEWGQKLQIIHKSRKRKGNKTAGGGVALVFNKSFGCFSEFHIQNNKFEIIAAIGTLPNSIRKIAVIGIYIPPRYNAANNISVLEKLAEVVSSIKLKYNNPLIITGGDYNKRDHSYAHENSPDMVQINTQPTRKEENLDVLYCNFIHDITELQTRPPLETRGGIRSDHDCVFGSFCINHVHVFEKKKIYVRPRTKKGEEKFKHLIIMHDWEEVLSASTPTTKVEMLNNTLEQFMDLCFPQKIFCIKSSDDPWINKEIKRLIKRRKREFKKYGRSERWKSLKKLTNDKIQEAKNKFFSEGREKAKKDGNSAAFYKVVNSVKDGEAPKQFDIKTLRPNLSTAELADDVALFFNKITKDYIPLKKCVQEPGNTRLLEKYEVASRLRKFKKPRSMTKGDIFPDLVGTYSDFLAIPLTDIFNLSRTTLSWPAAWKEETMVIIPKTSNPTEYSELRNLSCTALFSKILESYIIDDLKNELVGDSNQFGSTKGCGVDHYLIQTWDKLLNILEEESTACNLISIDFSKAFNSLDHQKCLDMFKKRGASKQSIGMLYTFLEGRKMRVKIDNVFSEPLPINGGSPQGTLLGNLIFIVTTSELEKDLTYETNTGTNEVIIETFANDGDTFPEAETSLDMSSNSDVFPAGFFKRSRYNVLASSSSEDDGAAELDNSIRDHELIRSELLPADWDPGPPMVVKYVDDILGTEALYIPAGKKHLSTKKQTTSMYAKQSEELIAQITDKAAAVGLKVNGKKTQMLCVNAAVSTCVSSYIRNRQEVSSRIKSAETMKILGFYFGSQPKADTHFEEMSRKFRKRLWFLRNIKRATVDQKELVECYCCFLRPILEYCSNVFGPMLSNTLVMKLEKLQTSALRIVFGYRLSSHELLQKAGLTTLEERRKILFRNFAMKVYNSPRFKEAWLPERPFTGHDLRRQNILVEHQSKTTRLYNSPLFALRRLLNDILIV